MQNILFSSLDTLNITQRELKLTKNLLQKTTNRKDVQIIDLLHHIPRYYIDRNIQEDLSHIKLNQITSLRLKPLQIQLNKQKNSRKPHRFICTDLSQKYQIDILYFTKHISWIEAKFRDNAELIISGKISYNNNILTMVHPDFVLTKEQEKQLPIIEPIYKLTHGLTNNILRKIIAKALRLIPAIPEWIPDDQLKQLELPNYATAIKNIHCPGNQLPHYNNCNLRRLAFDELLSSNIALFYSKNSTEQKKDCAIDIANNADILLKQQLKYNLTADQEQSLQDILADLSKTDAMFRLLQGDVGCGKTIVAALAMAKVAKAGFQTALMVPTEILARQHYENFKPLFAKLGFCTVLLTSKEPSSCRKKIKQQITDGSAQIIIGTHSLIQGDIQFKNLAFSVIDEQHRFGVEQRLELNKKSLYPNLLIMTATPIPRSLLLTMFSQTALSQIKQKPSNRKDIITTKCSISKISNLVYKIKEKLTQNIKIYWICPLIEQSEKLELISAEERYEILHSHFGHKIALIHGKTNAKEQEEIIKKFYHSEIQILVATTVIEVGVDVPDANIIIIENAERFGLSQLHQLRGRVGRGKLQSYCILLHEEKISAIAKQRLNILCQTNNGFLIAEKDLELRGEGEILGTKQSGNIDFLFLDLAEHQDIIKSCQNYIKKLEKTNYLYQNKSTFDLLLKLFHFSSTILA